MQKKELIYSTDKRAEKEEKQLCISQRKGHDLELKIEKKRNQRKKSRHSTIGIS